MTRTREWTFARGVVRMVAATGLLASGCGGHSPKGSNQAGDAGGPDARLGPDASGDGQGDGRDGPPVVEPAVSRAWTWSACGTMTPAPLDREALFGADGKIAVRSEQGIRVYDPAGTLQPESDGPADFLVTSPDGEVLVGRVTQSAIALSPIGGAAPLFTFAIPPSPGCGKVSAVSWSGAYVLARSADTACVWRTADGAFMKALTIVGRAAALRGDLLVSVLNVGPRSYILSRDLAGREASRLELPATVNASFSPAGDRLLTWDPPVLWNVDSGEALSWSADPGKAPEHASFNFAGDLVLLGGGVFRTADGALVTPLDPSSRIAIFTYQALALSPDGTSAVLGEFGRATLEAPSAPGLVAVLGGPTVPVNVEMPSFINQLALSADGSLLVANVLGSHAFGVRLAPDFGDSKIVSTLFTQLNADVDVSADGTIAAIAGDGKALFGAQDGRIIWTPPVPSPQVPSCPVEKLRLSPKKTWAAGADQGERIDVFAIAEVAGVDPPTPLLRVLSACGDSVVFSRDEGLMATSTPALYRTGATATEWQKVWSAPDPPRASSLNFYGEGVANDVRFSPDESQLLVSQCSDLTTCSTTLLKVDTGELVRALPQVTGPHPSFSPDGSWIVAGGTLVHLPSGDTRTIGPVGPVPPTMPPTAVIETALFAPDGNIIAGWSDGSLTRHCRSP